mmetsp:Transcript_19563/g.44077  ORF Transcript_19563/g.44077 Transcript_19563/m.44077 type:complete len:211 (-) Transcript_19563:116-748(-)
MIGHTIARLGCVLVGHVYPLYRTFKACRVIDEGDSPGRSRHAREEDQNRVLFFWAVHGLFTFAEFWLDLVMFLIPLYYEAKILLILWLVHDNFAGAKFVFVNLVEEALVTHEADIDRSLEVVRAESKRGFSRLLGGAASGIATLGAMALQRSHEMMLEKLAAPNPPKEAREGGRFTEVVSDQEQEEEEEEGHGARRRLRRRSPAAGKRST